MSEDKKLPGTPEAVPSGGAGAGADAPIVETPVDLTPADPAPAAPDAAGIAEATARIRAARGSDLPEARRIREEAVDLSAADREAAGPDRTAVPGTPGTDRDARRLVSLAVSLWVAAAVVGLIALVLALHPGAASPGDNEAFVDRGETSELMSQAADRVCAPFTFDYRKIDGYLAAARDAFVGEARKTFDTFADQQRQTIEQTKATQDCHAEYLGVSSIEGDRAVVVATFVISTSVNGVPSASGTPRALVHFERVDGQWRISEVEDV